MVKADAYGHGDVPISLALERQGVSALGVISVEEGIALRDGGVRAPVLTFGVAGLEYFKEILAYELTPVLSRWEQVKALEDLATTPIDIHLKFNTGMNRLGFAVEDAPKLATHFANSKKLLLRGVCTHFLNGEDAHDPSGHSANQVARFGHVEQAFHRLKPYVHYLNSAAILVGCHKSSLNILSNEQGIGARPGISMYGISPLPSQNDFGLKPVMSIYSRIEHTQKVPKGGVVSYGARWTATRDSVVGIVSIGYADGYFRSLTNKGQMIVRGQLVPVTGTVCMDYCMVDLTDVIGDGATLAGESVTVVGSSLGLHVTAKDLAEKVGTIPYELLTKVGRRLTRVYKE